MDNGNRFFTENHEEESESRFNRFDADANEEHSSRNRESRPRFVRVERSGRPQHYSRVERPSSPRSYSDSAEKFDRSNDPEQRPFGQRGGYSQRGYNQGGGYGQRGGYGQSRPSYNNYDREGQEGKPRGSYGQSSYGRRPSYGQNDRYEQPDRPSFYRERSEGGYERSGESRYKSGGAYSNSFRPRTGGMGPGRSGNSFNKKGKNMPNKKVPKGKRIEFTDVIHDPNEEIRLNKYLANAGVCSRREADDFITTGCVKVNGQTVTELGTKVKRGDVVLFHDQLVSIERKIYILLNKPKNCVTTVDDPQERKTVMDYIKGACRERVYPVGRLDRNTTGVLLLTNDGEMATRLTHPKFLKKKIYHVRLDKNVSAEDMEALLTGVSIGEGDQVRADEVSYVNDEKDQVGIAIHSGRNRVVRRMFDSLGYRVTKLDRVQFAGLTKKKLRRGDWRFLTEKEVNMLRMGAFE